MIAIDLLEEYGGIKKNYKSGELIFEENSLALQYFQIISGEVKMNNYNEEGKEFIQGIFYENQCFGEPPLFIEQVYPANAVAVTNTELIVITKNQLLDLLQNHSDISLKFIKNLSQRLYYKSVMAAEISSQDPEHRILRLIDYSIKQLNFKKETAGFHIHFTRQQIADLTGLRVETVIRAIKSLEKKGDLKIINRKVYR
ncbi:cyclic nucleotide-binding protein [Flavobacterium sp. L1I52]|uniref:Cyclic nucleotide-binding protein n=1 Tax=Flavobacterium pokkalii TaxID=1940408 RepID=A0ABR7UNA7_9FLAO|nr:Crp/Fnr family transcriptional regulator [Flavobacterium pokkalii]MBD0724365.1 cyclic nucleotide-binding protein [Flavobacterium pokkalii]